MKKEYGLDKAPTRRNFLSNGSAEKRAVIDAIFFIFGRTKYSESMRNDLNKIYKEKGVKIAGKYWLPIFKIQMVMLSHYDEISDDAMNSDEFFDLVVRVFGYMYDLSDEVYKTNTSLKEIKKAG